MEDAVFCRKCGKRRPQDPSRGRELQHGTLQYDSMVTTTEEWGPQQVWAQMTYSGSDTLLPAGPRALPIVTPLQVGFYLKNMTKF